MWLIRKTGEKVKAHIWLAEEQDTACRMWSTGGLKQERFEQVERRGDFEVCHMCRSRFPELPLEEDSEQLSLFSQSR